MNIEYTRLFLWPTHVSSSFERYSFRFAIKALLHECGCVCECETIKFVISTQNDDAYSYLSFLFLFLVFCLSICCSFIIFIHTYIFRCFTISMPCVCRYANVQVYRCEYLSSMLWMWYFNRFYLSF